MDVAQMHACMQGMCMCAVCVVHAYTHDMIKGTPGKLKTGCIRVMLLALLAAHWVTIGFAK